MSLKLAKLQRRNAIADMETLANSLARSGRKNFTKEEDRQFELAQANVLAAQKELGIDGDWLDHVFDKAIDAKISGEELNYDQFAHQREKLGAVAFGKVEQKAGGFDVEGIRREVNSLSAELLANRMGDLLTMANHAPQTCDLPRGYWQGIESRLERFKAGLACNFS
jgi:hypothetical protein